MAPAMPRGVTNNVFGCGDNVQAAKKIAKQANATQDLDKEQEALALMEEDNQVPFDLAFRPGVST
eukprot:2832527-Rhodomonas_salina.1